MDSLTAAMKVAGSGLEAQSIRLRTVAQNIANAQSTSDVAGGAPYRRQTVTFAQGLDSATGVSLVDAGRVGTDPSAFRMVHDPGSPAADAKGNVAMPNVDMLVEMADMREANRSYEANLQVMGQVRDMIRSTIDLMRGQ
ncbi:flagellar basal body rod protein FlgC [Rhizobiaceae bacterium]|nr:flagellar basal body rod protein FlgC [Rhizobiaceae bacterium]